MLKAPKVAEPQLLSLGGKWAAVKTERHTGLLALRALAHGSVLVDPGRKTVYFFISAGASLRWEPLPGVLVLGAGSHVTLPPAACTRPPGPYWLTELRRGIVPSPAPLLHRALAGVVPRPLPERGSVTTAQARGTACVWCAAPLGLCAVDLGVQQEDYQSLQLWFPRSCGLCHQTLPADQVRS